ncbi:ketopantoate reductase [Hydrogenispora ethanolica]|uniref:2-dehydropantoate 2-reductase n=1 Tax=Hydrogenispora ethanolica TaxID=1082276 RepID=A0A4R1SBP0_HYDET|nr:2-dehydropantoate 2-reductase [Hydrogenispora ethanolica]TCL76430.1 ketopantoate reductase [Hydrogenispora ethanolica]
MKIMLIGCGAVGLAVAAALYDAGAEVDLIARGATRESIAEKGIARRGIFPEVTIPAARVHVYDSPAATGRTGYDAILICAKTTANPAIAAQLTAAGPDLWAAGGCLILCQNGFQNERHFFACLERERIYTASFAIGFRRPEPHISEITVFSSPITIGSLFEGSLQRLGPLAETVERGGLPCKISATIGKTLWAKLLYNCALNPLSAVLRTDYGGLARSADAVFIMDRVIEEIFAVMQAAGYSTFWEDAAAYKEAFYGQILPLTHRHRSSTLQDIERRIPTEIDSLSGVIVRLGTEHGIATPYNAMLFRLIKAAESLYE